MFCLLLPLVEALIKLVFLKGKISLYMKEKFIKNVWMMSSLLLHLVEVTLQNLPACKEKLPFLL
jgi:hypothetical protein